MGFFDHIEELRWTLIKCAAVFAVLAGVIGFVYLKDLNEALMWPVRHVELQYQKVVLELGTITIMESFNIVIQMCCVGALALGMPFYLFFMGQFVAPALTEKELKVVLPLCFSAIILFLLGASFGFFLLAPSTLKVSIEINQLFGYAIRWTPGSYFGMMLWLVLGVGAAFEFPLAILLLVYLGVLSVSTLRKYRRHSVVAIFIIAAIVTPTPDPFTQTMFALPLWILFELSILTGAWMERRRKAKAVWNG